MLLQSKYVYYSETLINEYIERIHQMSYSLLSDNGMLQIFSLELLKLFSNIHGYLFSQILRFMEDK